MGASPVVLFDPVEPTVVSGSEVVPCVSWVACVVSVVVTAAVSVPVSPVIVDGPGGVWGTLRRP